MSSLRAGNVELQVLQQDCTPDKEVWLSDMTVPEQITPGERFTVEIEVTGNVATNAVLQLYNDMKLRRQEGVSLYKKEPIILPFRISENRRDLPITGR